MGTWSLCNHRALNGKSLSGGAQPGTGTTGRPRRQGVKVGLLCAAHTSQVGRSPMRCYLVGRARPRADVLTYKHVHSCSLAVQHVHFPINLEQQYYPAIHCRGVIDEAGGGGGRTVPDPTEELV